MEYCVCFAQLFGMLTYRPTFSHSTQVRLFAITQLGAVIVVDSAKIEPKSKSRTIRTQGPFEYTAELEYHLTWLHRSI